MHNSIATFSAQPAWTGDPEPVLKTIAAAGFTHIHWGHHWCDDFIYSPSETGQIRRWLKDYGLAMRDMHASSGGEKYYGSRREYVRLAGIHLIENRMEMTAALGGSVIVLHLVEPWQGKAADEDYWTPIRRSLDRLQRISAKCGVRIAVENGIFDLIEPLLREYDPAFLGLCYDAGHGNFKWVPDGLTRLDPLKDRLLVIHLHDNDGSDDLHRIPFWEQGTVDWKRLAAIVAASPYDGPATIESMRSDDIPDQEDFLARALAASRKFAGMVEAARVGKAGTCAIRRLTDIPPGSNGSRTLEGAAPSAPESE